MSATAKSAARRVFHIGDGVGANRVGGTPEEDEALRLAAGWMEEAGLEVEVDGRGNVVGRLRGRAPGAAGGLDRLAPRLGAGGRPLRRRARGRRGAGGGRARSGSRSGRSASSSSATRRRGATGAAGGSRHACAAGGVRRAARRAGARGWRERARRSASVTSHRRDRAAARVFEGRADHAGTTPMDGSASDALVAAAGVRAARSGRRARDRRRRRRRSGELEVEPGAANVIPGARAADGRRRARRTRSGSTGWSPSSAWTTRTTRSRPWQLAVRHVLREEVERARRCRWSSFRRARATTPASWRGRRRGVDALRPQPERRREPLAGRALERRGHRVALEVLTGALRRLAEAK